MIISLTIKNTAIIDKLTVDFVSGMNCLTGETGAGKSIIIDSICCLLGERASRENIRRGCDSASVQGVFNISSDAVGCVLNEFGIDGEEDGTLILFREYTANGKNTCRINGQTVTLSMLKKVGECLIDIHGQHDNHSLLLPSSHIELLDSFAGAQMDELKKIYREYLSRYKEINRELNELSGDPDERKIKAELLSFQVNEIKNANLTSGEEESLETRRKILANAESITETLNRAYSIIKESDGCGESVSDSISSLQGEFEKISGYNEKYAEILEKINDAAYALEDAASILRCEKDTDIYNREEADEIDRRLELIFNLKRKYGYNIDEILNFCRNAEEKLTFLIESEERCAVLYEERKNIYNKLEELCEDMNFLRSKTAAVIESSICKELSDMEMSKVRFKTEIDYRSEKTGEFLNFGKNGLDDVEFMISTNPGEPFRPLAKIASGGEMSRIMLAIKCVLADSDNIPVLIFDEIDTGISGQAALSVGMKFKKLAEKHQVICVSHLAQIAAIAGNNIFISKILTEDSTVTSAKCLNGEEKVMEICRLLDGGTVTDATMQHARELISRVSVN